MAILQECPDCTTKQSLKNKKCKCGENLDKAKKSRRVKYHIYFRTPSGKQKTEYISKSLDEAKASDAKIKVIKKENRFLDVVPDQKTTFYQLADWYKDLKKVQELKTYVRVLELIKNFNDFFGDTYVSKIEFSDLENYQVTRLKSGAAKAQVDYELSVVKTMIKKAFYNDKVHGKTLKTFQRVSKLLKRNENRRDRILTPEEFERLIENLPNHLKPIIATGYFTGMRKEEILGMTWDRVNLKKRFFALYIEHTKDKEKRIVTMCDELYLFISSLKKGGSEFVFLYKEKPMKDIRTGLKDACKKTGIIYGRNKKNGFTFHDLRHTFNTNMRKAGVPESVIMGITGHSTREMFDRYNTVDFEDMKKASEKMSAYLYKD
ncbi:MAG: site-specific integrase [Desulfobacterales bacterium]|nr:site-specific integrase [Desulfobacterales bacterium]